MTENASDYSDLVQLKMQARAERHLRENQAIADEQVRETEAALAAQVVVEQAQRALAAQRLQRETEAEARRQRPNLLAHYKVAPAGVRLVTTLRDVCLNCGSESIRVHSASRPHVRMCANCNTEWFANPCWSCSTGQLDSRDPETAPCPSCGHLKCTDCEACNPHGCSTNPYTRAHRQRDEAAGLS